MSEPTTIISLTAENVKRLKAVKVTPLGAVVTVGGRNGQGKSSLLDCIAMALGGKDAVPPEPIRRGQSKAKIVLETQELIVTRKFTAGGSALEVQNKEGLRFPSPQAVLDKLCASLAFDPLSFVRAGRKEQLTQLRALVGVDTSGIEADRATAFDNRTEVNRRVKSQAAVVESLPESGPAEINVTELLEELKEAEETNKSAALKESYYKKQLDRVANGLSFIADNERRVEQLAGELAREKESLSKAKAHLVEVQGETESARVVMSLAPQADTSKTREQIASAEGVNREAAKVTQRKAEAEKLATLEKESDALTKRIETLDKQKEETLAAAKFPVAGLGFDANGITFNGIPFEQSSSAEQLRVGLAIACGMNPSLRVMLIRDGSLLDDDSLALVAETAEKHGAQVWLERVGNDGRCTVVIEDGSAVEDTEVAA